MAPKRKLDEIGGVVDESGSFRVRLKLSGRSVEGPRRGNEQLALGDLNAIRALTGTVRLKGIKPFARGCLKHNSGRCMLILLVRCCLKGFPDAL